MHRCRFDACNMDCLQLASETVYNGENVGASVEARQWTHEIDVDVRVVLHQHFDAFRRRLCAASH